MISHSVHFCGYMLANIWNILTRKKDLWLTFYIVFLRLFMIIQIYVMNNNRDQWLSICFPLLIILQSSTHIRDIFTQHTFLSLLTSLYTCLLNERTPRFLQLFSLGNSCSNIGIFAFHCLIHWTTNICTLIISFLSTEKSRENLTCSMITQRDHQFALQHYKASFCSGRGIHYIVSIV